MSINSAEYCLQFTNYVGYFLVLKVWVFLFFFFTTFKGVTKVRNINNLIWLNTVGYTCDEYIKI